MNAARYTGNGDGDNDDDKNHIDPWFVNIVSK